MKFKKKYQNIVFSDRSNIILSAYVNEIKKKGYYVRSACDGFDVLGILIYSNTRYDLALLELDVLLKPLKDMNSRNPFMFKNCEEKNLPGLVEIIKNCNKRIKVVGFSEHTKKEYDLFYEPFDMKTGMDRYILKLKLENYIKKDFRC